MGVPDRETDESRRPDTSPDLARRYRRLSILIAVALAPWNVVVRGSFVSSFHAFGIVNLDPLGLTSIVEYYFLYTQGLQPYLNAWGLGVFAFAVGLASALSGLIWREDVRVTAAMFVLAGFAQLVFTLGFLRRPGYVAVPVGTVLLWGVVWRYYRDDLRAIFRYP